MSRPDDAASDREIVITREFAAPRDLVWKVWTEPRHVARWWGPRGFTTTVTELDLRPGGRSRYVMRGPDGKEYPVSGVFIEVVPPERIVTTDEFGDGYEEVAGVDLPKGIVLTATFEDLGGKTRLTLRIAHPTAEDRRKHEAMGVVGGWHSSFDCMDDHLAELRAGAAAKIFVNLPVKDLGRAVGFYTGLGFRPEPRFTDATAACLVVSDTIHVMALTEAKFKTFTPKPVCDATKSTEVLLALSCETRARVDELVRAAVAAGGATYAEPKDYGFMYQHGFQDPDGHIWELVHMDPAAVPPG